ncbi:ABC transporter ATP-binding protein [Aquabacterium sp.]|uniref:ABC transporter ATP-binding protein n=1 Tax=Aquabacterium sp. TaxID=1872578 RepID=UPI0025C6BD59|nr:ABC transporter ATP-binding protein [Aquabacterium sp.]
MNAPAPAIEVLSAEQVYPNGTRALMPVDLTIQPGEFVTLLGPSGCGKSTLLKMIAGLLAPSDGRILLSRKHVHDAQVDHRLSFVFQEATLMPWATVAANVRLPLDLAGVPAVQGNARVEKVLNMVGLGQFGQSRPRELSGGMQMRVSIARGLVTEPRLLLMDEPFGALDEITRNKLDADLLELWQRQQLTSVFVTHSITEAVFLSTRVIVMAARPGRVVEDLSITAPYPRDDDFRTSLEFNELVRHLQHSLTQASRETA